MPDGYGVDQGTLGTIAGLLSRASSQLTEGMQADLPPADAGVSSPDVAGAVTRVLRHGLLFATGTSRMVENIDFTDASYADIENSVEGAMRYSENRDSPASDPGELRDAPNRNNFLPGRRR
jgi:hypothetical protein